MATAKDDKERTSPADVVAALKAEDPKGVEYDATNELLDNDDLPNADDLAALKAQGMVLLPSGRLAHESELDPNVESVIAPPQAANLERRQTLRKLAEAAGLSVGEGLENDERDRQIAANEQEVEAMRERAKYDGPGREEQTNTAKRRLAGAEAALRYWRGERDGSGSDTAADTGEDGDAAAAARTRAAQTTRSATPQGRTATPKASTTQAKP